MPDDLTDAQLKEWCSNIRMCVDCDAILSFNDPYFYEIDKWARRVATEGNRCALHPRAKSMLAYVW